MITNFLIIMMMKRIGRTILTGTRANCPQQTMWCVSIQTANSIRMLKCFMPTRVQTPTY